jgi:hypothetical protein
MRRHFMRRIAIAFVAFFLFMFLIGAFAFGIFSRFGAGEGPRDHFVPFFPLVGIVLLLVGGVAAGRAVRRTAAPIADVMEAADRVAGGDYSARVEPRGTRETAGSDARSMRWPSALRRARTGDESCSPTSHTSCELRSR